MDSGYLEMALGTWRWLWVPGDGSGYLEMDSGHLAMNSIYLEMESIDLEIDSRHWDMVV